MWRRTQRSNSDPDFNPEHDRDACNQPLLSRLVTITSQFRHIQHIHFRTRPWAVPVLKCHSFWLHLMRRREGYSESSHRTSPCSCTRPGRMRFQSHFSGIFRVLWMETEPSTPVTVSHHLTGYWLIQTHLRNSTPFFTRTVTLYNCPCTHLASFHDIRPLVSNAQPLNVKSLRSFCGY